MTVVPLHRAQADLLDRLVPWVTNSIRVEGSAIHWGGTLTANKVELLDNDGTYATLDNVRIVWSPTQLLFHRRLVVDSLSADGGEVARLPASSSSGGSGMPNNMDVRQVALDNLALARAVAGAATVLNVRAAGRRDGPNQAQGALTAAQVDGGGRYAVAALLGADGITLKATVEENSGGLMAQVAGLPDLGAISLVASLTGPRSDLKTELSLTAGKLAADAHGQVDLAKGRLSLAAAANAPAMQPRPDLGWRSLALNARIDGAFMSPDVTGTMRAQFVTAAATSARELALDVAGNKGHVQLSGQIDGLVLPGRNPDLFAGAPLVLSADATLAAPGMPMTFSVRHPVFDASGAVQLEARLGSMELKIPELRPFTTEAGVDLAGRAAILVAAAEQAGAIRVGMHGTVGLTAGPNPAPALVGPAATINLAGQLEGRSVTLSQLSFDGQDMALSAKGSVSENAVDLAFGGRLDRLAPVDPRVAGELRMQGRASGATNNIGLSVQLSGNVSYEGQASGPFTAGLDAHGLPHAPRGQIAVDGALLGSPIRLAATGGRQPDGAVAVAIQQADWKSARARGALTLPAGATLPRGQVTLEVGQLADFGPLIGKSLRGSARAALEASAERAVLTGETNDVAIPGIASIGKAAFRATIENPATRPVVDGSLTLTGLNAGNVGGSARLSAAGPAQAIAVNFGANSNNLGGTPARLTGAGVVDVPARSVRLDMVQAGWKGQNLRLLAPVRVVAAQGVDIDHLRLGLDKAVVEVDGRVGSTLDLTARARDLPASLAALVSPGIAAEGTLSAEARLAGTASAPLGTVRVQGAGLRAKTKNGPAMPAVSLIAVANLQGKDASVDARATAGTSHLSVTGRAPFSMTAPLELHANGLVDLGLADPLLAQERLAGRVTLAADIRGTAAKPDGTIRAQASDVRVLGGPGAALPPASVTAVAEIKSGTARIDTRVAAGKSHLAVTGNANLASGGALALRATGAVDLAMAEPVLAAKGEAVHGTLTLDAGVTGTTSAPRLTGGAALAGGDFRDYTEGVHLSDVAARIAAEGETLRLVSLNARAGDGSISGSGTVGVFASGVPVDLRFAARNATPISGDLLTAQFNADLAITGAAEQQIMLGGSIAVRQAVIRIPERLPTSVKTIPVRVAGAPPPVPKKPSSVAAVIALNLTVAAPQQVFIRGRGLNVELGGTVRIAGTTAKMLPSGRFDLIRGSLNLVGNTLTFTSGDIDFNGGTITDPAIHLVASTLAPSMTAQLVVGGTARAPTVTLTSTPPLPQDEVLAQLLFHTNAGALSPFQLASIASGLAELTGAGGGIGNPLAGVQNALGLDQLGIGTGANGNPTLQAGRYLTRRIYVGAQQATGGAGAQGTVQVDIAKGLKLNATVGNGETTSAIGSTGQTNGASIGMTYTFQY